MRSCLEIYSMDGTTNLPYGRHQQTLRNDYQRKDNEYSNTHSDALSYNAPGGNNSRIHKGDGHEYTLGKGTGNAPHIDWQPNCTAQMGVFISGFDTSIESGAGNEEDNAARNSMLTRSKYNNTYRYDYEASVDTIMNVNEGQFVLR